MSHNNDLISKSALLELAHNHVGGTVDCNDIARFPAVDAVEVRHGRWLNKTERIYADLNYRFDCSICSHIFYSAGIETFNYCPNCGAKMDGDKDD